jgi:hypothetical protein
VPNYLIVFGRSIFDCPTAVLYIAPDPPNTNLQEFALFSATNHTKLQNVWLPRQLLSELPDIFCQMHRFGCSLIG